MSFDADLGKKNPDTFLAPSIPKPRRLLFANPSFNNSVWLRKDDDVRWQFGGPPKGNQADCDVQILAGPLAW